MLRPGSPFPLPPCIFLINTRVHTHIKQQEQPAAPEEANGKKTPVRKVKGLEEKLAKLAKGEGAEEGGGPEGDEEEEEEQLPEGALAGPLGEAMDGAGVMEEDDGEGPDAEVYRRQREEAAKATLFKGEGGEKEKGKREDGRLSPS